MLRAVIIDDEEAGVDIIRILASRNAGVIKVVAAALRAEEGIALIEDYKPDVVFLDISMPDMSGFDLLSRLNYRGFHLVFTTAYAEHAIQAIKNKAFDYLLKPVSDADFRNCLDELMAAQKKTSVTPGQHHHQYIEIQVKDGVIYLRQKDIIRLEAARSYTEFYLDNKTRHIASKSLKDFEPKLDPGMFFRCHKSHIVNLHKIEKFINHDGFYALMSDGSKPLISKVYKDDFLERLKTL